MKKRTFKIERTDSDDILDALSMRINKDLRTEKDQDDKKNNVYFWLFKFLILIAYLLIINACFFLAKEIGVQLIYFFAVSLRSVLAFIYRTGLTFIQLILTTYVLLKNLKIFTKSSYYKRLYAKDRYMLKKKKNFFVTIEKVLQAFGVVYLVCIAFIAFFLVSIITVLIPLAVNKYFMFSLFAIVLILLIMCGFVFGEIKNKFFGYPSMIRKEHLYIGVAALLVALVCFGYETSSYKINASLPDNMDTINKSLTINIEHIDQVYIESNAKFNNIELIVDNSLDDAITIDVEYFKTSRTSYVSYFNEKDDLLLKFDGETDFKIENIPDVFQLGVETIRTKTIYNYNMFKYPKVKVFVGLDDYDRIHIDGNLNK